MEKQGGIYARYSPGRDRDQTSTIEAQVAMCREKAQREGIAIDVRDAKDITRFTEEFLAKQFSSPLAADSPADPPAEA